MIFFNQYSQDRPRPKQDNAGMPSMTQKNLGNECDINTIIDHYNRTGVLTSMGQRNAPLSYGNFSDASDFQELQNRILEARNAFMELPAKTRRFFANDPANLFEFLSHEENRQMAIDMGLLDKKKVEDMKKATEAAASAKGGNPLSKDESNEEGEPPKRKMKKEVAE